MQHMKYRRAPRFAIAFPVAVSCKSLEQLAHLQTADASSSGLFIRSPEPLPVGTSVDLQINVCGETLRIRAHVTRCVTEPEDKSGIGVEFDSPNDEDVQRLALAATTNGTPIGPPPAPVAPDLEQLLKTVEHQTAALEEPIDDPRAALTQLLALSEICTIETFESYESPKLDQLARTLISRLRSRIVALQEQALAEPASTVSSIAERDIPARAANAIFDRRTSANLPSVASLVDKAPRLTTHEARTSANLPSLNSLMAASGNPVKSAAIRATSATLRPVDVLPTREDDAQTAGGNRAANALGILVQDARKLVDSGRTTSAKRLLETVVATTPNQTEALALLALLKARDATAHGDRASARQHYRDVLVHEPTNAEAIEELRKDSADAVEALSSTDLIPTAE